MFSIYVLKDPRDNSVHYVGKTTKPEQRHKEHIVPGWSSTTEKRNWILELRTLGLKPILEVIETIEDHQEATWKETVWIQRYTSEGAILFNQHCVHERRYKERWNLK